MTVRNSSSRDITLVEVDYPSASFGFQDIQPDTERRYRFKVLGSGPIKLTYVDAGGHERHGLGPELREGQSGSIRITVQADNQSWQTALSK